MAQSLNSILIDDTLISCITPEALEKLCKKIKAVQSFYAQKIKEHPKREKEILKDYSEFISLAKQVKKGEITANTALSVVDAKASDQHVNETISDILKAFELVALATLAMFSAIFLGAGISIMSCEPITGLAAVFLSTTILCWAIDSLFEDIDVVTEDEIKEEQEVKTKLLSFFKPKNEASEQLACEDTDYDFFPADASPA